jgi:hypothetical protein
MSASSISEMAGTNPSLSPAILISNAEIVYGELTELDIMGDDVEGRCSKGVD